MQESRTYWFNAASIDADDEFMLMGLVLGLAIYNAVLLDFPLPQARLPSGTDPDQYVVGLRRRLVELGEQQFLRERFWCFGDFICGVPTGVSPLFDSKGRI